VPQRRSPDVFRWFGAYAVYKSTTASTGTYSSTAAGLSTTSWTSASLTAGNDYFNVAAYMGTKWLSS
jgi:hypothetical protein